MTYEEITELKNRNRTLIRSLAKSVNYIGIGRNNEKYTISIGVTNPDELNNFPAEIEGAEVAVFISEKINAYEE